MNNRKKLMILLFVFTLFPPFFLLGCDESSSNVSEENQFEWWITETDSEGTFYEGYEENPVIQWLNNQTWEVGNLGPKDDGTGTQLEFSFQNPITGTEADQFNTMMATGGYPEIVDLSYSNDSPRLLHEDGVLIEITEYVEAYMPNYLAFLDKNPNLKPFVSHTDENGDVHYYSLYGLIDSQRTPFQGYIYRRDWLVKYATPSSHVWDWESDHIETNGHPKYTPLSEAKAQGDMTGWKENTVTEFTSNFGDDETWEDNIIFPSGKTDPLTISDWEWMLKAFKNAIEAEGFSDDNNAYPTTLYYLGYLQTGDLVSSFGGGGPMWYIDQNGDAAFGATDDDFKTYLSTMHKWYENGWLDSSFETRGSDMFYKINMTGVNQGKVGLWQGYISYLGTTIRATAANEAAQHDAMVYGAALPINDMYGDASQKFVEPYTFYGEGKLGQPTGFTEKIKDKNLELLFTMLDWLYTREGALTTHIGLNEEQLASMTFDPDVYAEQDIETAYTVSENPDGTLHYKTTVSMGNRVLFDALRNQRMTSQLQLYGTDEYTIDYGYDMATQMAIEQWTKYENTGYILNHNGLFDEDTSSMYARINTYVNDTMGVQIPGLIKNGMGDWDTYVAKINKYGPERITAIYQQIIDEKFS